MNLVGRNLFIVLIGITATQFIAAQNTNSFCEQYRGESASDTFCQDVACKKFCESTTMPFYCMDVNYVKTSKCSYHGDHPPSYCTSRLEGVELKYDNWCQTVACSYATYKCLKSSRYNCYRKIGYWVSLSHGEYCKEKEGSCEEDACGSDNETPPGSSSSKPNESQTTTPKPNASQTTTPKPNKSQTTTPKPNASQTTTPKPNKSQTTTPKPNKSQTTTEAPSSEGCYAKTDWQSGPCTLCPRTTSADSQCPSFSWTYCYPTLKECNKYAGGGGSCDAECPENTKNIKRPTFKSLNCYDAQYGSQFGPDWAPSKRTSFEKYVTNPSHLYRLIQVTQEDVPIMSKQWKLNGCDAATAMYESMVCALELIEHRGKTFDPPKHGTQKASITEFCNSPDDQINRLEAASFFSHKFKETGRFVAWEEITGTSYAEPHSTYPPVPGVTYHGRGPIQLSYNYNYGAFSEWLFDDKNILLQDPDKVDPEGPMGFIAAFWFWFSPRDFYSMAPVGGSIRTRDAIIHWKDNKMNALYNDNVDYDKYAGLGLSTNVINGGIECTSNGESGLWRVTYFLSVASRLQVEIPNMNDFDACQADKYCRGLTSGCRATNTPIKCTATNADCDAEPGHDWETYTCAFA